MRHLLSVRSTDRKLTPTLFPGSVGDMDKECVVCLSAPATMLIQDCFHLCLCEDCQYSFKANKDTCPECRKPIKRIRQTFY